MPRKVLPKGSESLLMSEEEYINTLKSGEKLPVPDIYSKKKKKVTYVEQNIQECQPTSSKVKIEDLITDEEERRLDEASRIAEQGTVADNNTRSFWDRPVPKQQVIWDHDPRMPKEWNDVVSAMRLYEEDQTRVIGTLYREPMPSEVSGKYDFTKSYKTSVKDKDWMRKQSSVRLEVRDNWEDNMKNLRKRFEAEKPPPTPKPKKPDKGKSPMKSLTEEDYPRLRQQWYDEYQDIMGGVKVQLPPWREVNHEIHLMDDNKRYNYHLPRCPNSLREEFHNKINMYVDAGWWEPRSVSQAAPLLCIPKRDGKLRTVVDARQ